MIQAVRGDRRVDPRRVGLWAASNGGWVAPIVATKYPIAFMILKSAPSESIISNVLYEIEQSLREHGQFTSAQIAAAMSFERTVLDSLQSNSNWGDAASALASAKQEPWFSYMRIPPGISVPPSPPMLAALQASLIFDPIQTLEQVRVPTLAIFGALDKNVDEADSQERFRSAFRRAGMSDFTVRVFPDIGHTLLESQTGYMDEPDLPQRYTGYPEAMIGWLQVRGFAFTFIPKFQSAAARRAQAIVAMQPSVAFKRTPLNKSDIGNIRAYPIINKYQTLLNIRAM